MILGCDIGTSVTKAVLFEEGRFLCGLKTGTEANPDKALDKLLGELLRERGLREADLAEIVVTGWGQGKVSLRHKTMATMNCLGRAAVWDVPSCRSVLCLGAQQSVVLSVNERGRVLEYRMNDKCASGAGKFLELIFEALGCEVEESARIAKSADKRVAVTSQCTVFAESEVVSLVNDGESVANITEAILEALSKSVTTLCKKIKVEAEFVIGGGIANNQRVVEQLEEGLGRRLHVFRPQPSFIAAVGAALSAKGDGV